MYTHGDDSPFDDGLSSTKSSRVAARDRLKDLLDLYEAGICDVVVQSRKINGVEADRSVNDLIYEALRQVFGRGHGLRLHRCPNHIQIAQTHLEMISALRASIDGGCVSDMLYWLDALRTRENHRPAVVAR